MTGSAKGFDAYFADRKLNAQREKASIDCKSVVYLSKEEIEELDQLRIAALSNYSQEIHADVSPIKIEEELAYVPSSLKLTDKLVFRMCDQGVLLAYALVFCSWPKVDEWTIEQLYINPSYKRQGLGSKLINKIENVARTAEIKATSILSMPKRSNSESFWKIIGYTEIQQGSNQIFRKEL